MRHFHCMPLQRPQEFYITVATNAECMASVHHAHYQPQYAGSCRAAIYQITDEGQCSSDGRSHHTIFRCPIDPVAERGNQRQQFLQATMHISDNVKRSGFAPVQQIAGMNGHRTILGKVASTLRWSTHR